MNSPLLCKNCGSQVRPNAKFCPQCRYPLAATPALETQRLSVGPLLLVKIPQNPTFKVSLSSVPITIGREPSNQLVIPIAEASRHHAQIVNQAGDYAVIDLNSSNGTYLQGRRILAQQPAILSHGDVIRIGDRWGNSISITYLATDDQPISGTLHIGPYSLGNRASLTIGRENSDINLSHPAVSRFHAEISKHGTKHQIRDLGSTNGTFINGQVIRQAILNIGDQLQIGPFRLIYQGDALVGESSVGSIRVDGSQLYKAFPVRKKTSLKLVNVPPSKWPATFLSWATKRFKPQKENKIILNSISLTVMPREFVALVGGSGAGKSTLMDALSGFRHAHQGAVLVNGDDLYQSYDLYRTNMGYVPQQDIIHTGLTVGKALRYAAMLRLPSDTQEQVIEKRIEDVLQQVDMERQIDQQINSLSGGQRKRVSIASELISEPSLFFLDEPTSGLDPGLDKTMMSTLRVLADRGRTIILTTHATNNIIGQCDHVCFLAFGRMVFYGPPQQAMLFFQADDFADIYSKLNDPQNAEQYETAYHKSDEYKQFVMDRQQNIPQSSSTRKVPKGVATANTVKINLAAHIRQFGILARRYLDLILNDRFSLFILLAVMPIIGVLLLLIANPKCFVGDSISQIELILEKDGYYNIASEGQKLLLMMALPTFLLGVFASAYEIIKEKPIYRRERMINLSIPAYLLSKVGVLLGFGFIQSLALMIVVSLKVDYPKDGVFVPAPLEIYLSLVVALFVGIAMGLLISALVKSSNTVIYLILVVLIVQIIFSGALFDLPDAANWLSAITPTRWAMEGLGSTVNMQKLNNLTQSYIEEIEIQGHETDVDSAIDAPMDFSVNYDRSFGHLFGTWTMQLMIATVSLILAGFVLKRQDVQS